jgi:hypothetical protein
LTRAARALDLTALLLVFEPPLLRRARRLRRATHLRLDARLLDEIRQPFHRIALVVFLRAKALRA